MERLLTSFSSFFVLTSAMRSCSLRDSICLPWSFANNIKPSASPSSSLRVSGTSERARAGLDFLTDDSFLAFESASSLRMASSSLSAFVICSCKSVCSWPASFLCLPSSLLACSSCVLRVIISVVAALAAVFPLCSTIACNEILALFKPSNSSFSSATSLECVSSISLVSSSLTLSPPSCSASLVAESKALCNASISSITAEWSFLALISASSMLSISSLSDEASSLESRSAFSKASTSSLEERLSARRRVISPSKSEIFSACLLLASMRASEFARASCSAARNSSWVKRSSSLRSSRSSLICCASPSESLCFFSSSTLELSTLERSATETLSSDARQSLASASSRILSASASFPSVSDSFCSDSMSCSVTNSNSSSSV
mmetsp:Transcript_14092/g.20601  ORF Transcript_14092/g.20601 Transcript_14092/m.20601 type:complete len:379 (-) Transcript_14092:795-1931(-)